jgi:branched-chain amino acid transport system ATP-binding protein
MAPLLEIQDVTTGYGDLKVIRGLSLTVEKGAIEVVLGRNGVGKTTLLSAVSGLIPLWSGSVRLDGREVGRRPPYRRAAAGIALVQEGKRIFHERTVLENVLLGTFSRKLSRVRRLEECREVLEHFPILQERERQLAGALSGGQQQMLAIAQALAAAPKLLLLDEPSAGLAPAIVAEVFDQIVRLRERGLTVLLVEQLAERALAVADHVTVINDGQVVRSGPPTAFRDGAELQAAYFGERVPEHA